MTEITIRTRLRRQFRRRTRRVGERGRRRLHQRHIRYQLPGLDPFPGERPVRSAGTRRVRGPADRGRGRLACPAGSQAFSAASGVTLTAASPSNIRSRSWGRLRSARRRTTAPACCCCTSYRRPRRPASGDRPAARWTGVAAAVLDRRLCAAAEASRRPRQVRLEPDERSAAVSRRTYLAQGRARVTILRAARRRHRGSLYRSAGHADETARCRRRDRVLGDRRSAGGHRLFVR